MIPLPALTWQTKLILLAALFLVGMFCGYRLSDALEARKREKVLEAQLTSYAAVREFDGVLQDITNQSSTRLANSVVPRGTITVEKEVIHYVQKPATACRLDADWVHVYNLSTDPSATPAGR